METIPLTEEDVKKYLDSCIRIWRRIQDETGDFNLVEKAPYYIDAYQSVRMSLFGKTLPKEQ